MAAYYRQYKSNNNSESDGLCPFVCICLQLWSLTVSPLQLLVCNIL